jgi:hypothetical protein
MGKACDMYGERRGALRVYLGITEEKKPGHRWEDNIKMGF